MGVSGLEGRASGQAMGRAMVGEELSALALVEVIVGNGLGFGGIEGGRLIEVVGEGILGDLLCISTGWVHGEFGLRRSPGRMDERG